ncbi:hypothetical protein [Enterocloster hominis (ex Hitch et al. 2024)]|uniref:hypothetical protein n=1 Tax=Enterocloster hominis (ex Hitch et al. 2024) TaxID=1917870 RepID=UPI002E2F4238|nr:hypothetical protein [Lachnoclostridium pacaense]
MNGLRVIESELVPVYVTSTGEKVVYGTELYECLGSKQEYSNWVKNRLRELILLKMRTLRQFYQKVPVVGQSRNIS